MGSAADNPAFHFSTPPAVGSSNSSASSGGLPDWLQTGLGLLGGVVGTGVTAYTAIQSAKNPKPLSADYEEDMRARERDGYNVPRQVGIPTWLIVAGVVAVGALVIAAVKE